MKEVKSTLEKLDSEMRSLLAPDGYGSTVKPLFSKLTLAS
jgi:hypothetical protein